ncbi:threonine synthase [Marinithermofilum abyssi]|uniref:Threonine synthase n=2 Tax=Marinithermofilum abyssi TaxID=1571185 RepID=A0A8J2VI39_9BACL|nr:threonine synthase [Marinithermofilum abyssi]
MVEYDLDRVKAKMTREVLQRRPASMWRYRELLPVQNQQAVVSLGEGWTPLLSLDRWAKSLPVGQIWVKREEQNPTGSFKARGFSVAVSLLQERSIRKAAVPSNGNAASALAAYAARAGIEAYVFVPQDCPGMFVREAVSFGASTWLVDGLIHDAGKIIEDGKKEHGWFNVGTAKEPGRLEGKKTMGLEMAEQMGWQLPDVILYPTGGGSGLIGIWKAFRELKALGLVQGEMPRFVSVQEEGCTPIVDAVKKQTTQVIPPANPPASSPTGVRVPRPPAGALILSILRETEGTAVAVTAEEIADAQRILGAHGISASPEGGAVAAALLWLCDSGFIRSDDRVVLFNTAHALKYWHYPAPREISVIREYREME